MTLFTASLYILTIAFLFGSALFVLSRDPRNRLNFYYFILAIGLLGWVSTLFVFSGLPEGPTLLIVGRVNFAAVAVAVTASYLLCTELAERRPRNSRWVWLETLAVVAICVWTPLIDRSEAVQTGQHITTYGPLIWAYSLHILAYVVAALRLAMRSDCSLPRMVRSQLRIVGTGILATGTLAFMTNIVLPVWFGNFSLIYAGALSTVLLLAAITYAVVSARLFNIRVILRATLIYTILVSLAIEVYGAAVHFLSELLPLGSVTERHFAATAIALVVNAATNDTLRKWLERIIDRITDRTNLSRSSRLL